MSNNSLHNYSNQTSTSEESLASWIANHIISPLQAYFLPVLVGFTVISNILVIAIFITCKDVTKRIKSSIRVYYIATAIGDITVCLAIHLSLFLEDGLFYITNGSFGVLWDQGNSIVCKSKEVWFLVAESFTLWLNVLLVSERYFALNWPFLARRLANAKNAVALCIAVLIFGILLQIPLIVTPDTFGVYAMPLTHTGYACTLNLYASKAFLLVFDFTSVCGYTIYPEVLLIIMDILLAASIASISRERRKMKGSASGGKSDLNAAFVILLIAALPLLVYVPNAIFWTPFILSSLIPAIDLNLTYTFSMLGTFTLDLSILVHAWNIFVYTARVSGFRVELVRILTCGLYKPISTHSQSSATSHSVQPVSTAN